MTQPIPALSAARIAAEVSRCLDEVVPAGFSVVAEGARVVIRYEGRVLGYSDAPDIVGSLAASSAPDQHAETAIRATMARIQNYVVEVLGRPWPAADGELPQPRTRRLARVSIDHGLVGVAAMSWFSAVTL